MKNKILPETEKFSMTEEEFEKTPQNILWNLIHARHVEGIAFKDFLSVCARFDDEMPYDRARDLVDLVEKYDCDFGDEFRVTLVRWLVHKYYGRRINLSADIYGNMFVRLTRNFYALWREGYEDNQPALTIFEIPTL